MNTNLKIFIAEDEDVLREIYSERFLKSGFDVKTFRNGLELISALSDDTPNIILLDVNMPEMNGYEVLQTIKENFQAQDKQDVIVAIWSNLSSDADVQRAMRAGATTYFKKSEFSGQDLVEGVRGLCTKNMSAKKN